MVATTYENQESSGLILGICLGSLAITGVLFGIVNVLSDNNAMNWLILLTAVQLTPLGVMLIRRRPDFIVFMTVQAWAVSTSNKLHWIADSPSSVRYLPSVIRALQEETFCCAITVLAFYFLRFTLFHLPDLKEEYLPVSVSPRVVICCLILILGQSTVYTFVPDSLLSLTNNFITGATIFLICSSCPAMPKLPYIAQGLAFLGVLHEFLIHGSLVGVGLYAVYMVIAAILRRKVKYLFAAVPVGIAMIGLQSVKYSYRLQVNDSLGTEERVEMLSELLLQKPDVSEIDLPVVNMEDGEVDDEIKAAKDGLFWSSFSRVGDSSLERVLQSTPERVLYWNGETYYSLLLVFIPRVIWPDKPGRAYWNKFGRVYGYLDPSDMQTSVSVSYLAEGYMNYGYMGMYGAALFMGFLAAAMQRLGFTLLGRPSAFVFVFLLFPLLGYTADLGTIINVLIINLALLLVLRRWLMSLSRSDDYS